MTTDNKAVVKEFIDRLFTTGDVSVLDELAAPGYVDHDPPFGGTGTVEGWRAMATMNRDDHVPPDGAGVIVLGPDLSVVSINAPADGWLDDIAGEWPSTFDVPVPVIAAAARVIAPDLDGPVESVVARLPSKRGGWISVQASRLRGRGREEVVVVVQPATTQEVGSLVLAAHGLTPAQQRVAALVLQGRSTAEIVTTLHISTNTLQEHLRAVFDRFGVGSRRELVAALMA